MQDWILGNNVINNVQFLAHTDRFKTSIYHQEPLVFLTLKVMVPIDLHFIWITKDHGFR